MRHSQTHNRQGLGRALTGGMPTHCEFVSVVRGLLYVCQMPDHHPSTKPRRSQKALTKIRAKAARQEVVNSAVTPVGLPEIAHGSR